MENLKMLVSGRQLNTYQKALAKREFEGLLERLELFEQQLKILNIPAVIKSVCPDCNGLTAIMGTDGIFRPCHCQSQTVL